MTGVCSITVYGGAGQRPSGGLPTPTNTIFQLAPFHLPHSAFRESHCCCDPELTWPSILQSAMKPPLDQPPSQRFKSPLTCTRRSAVACETAQIFMFWSSVGLTERFSTERQKLHVAFCLAIQRALERTAPVTST